MKIWEKVLLIFTAVIPITGIIYREIWYQKIPVAPGEPYGGGDILDLVFAIAVLMVCGSTLFLGLLRLFIPYWHDRRKAMIFSLTAIGSALTFFIYHGYIQYLIKQLLR